MTVKTPKLIELLKNAGLGENEINNMREKEFRELVVALGEEHGSSFEAIQEKLDGKQVHYINDPLPIITIEDNDNSFTTFPPPPVFEEDDSKYEIKLITDEDVYKQRNMLSVDDLHTYRRQLVRSLIISESERYIHSLNNLVSKLPPESPSNFLVSVILHNGIRINRSFPLESQISQVYIFVANQKSLQDDQIKLGNFILIEKDGNEADPSKDFSSFSDPHHVLLLMRLL